MQHIGNALDRILKAIEGTLAGVVEGLFPAPPVPVPIPVEKPLPDPRFR